VSSPAIHAQGLRRTFGEVVAVERLDLDVAEGEIFGLVGPDGAGKSTTMRMLTGFIRPTSGSARIAGIDVAKDPVAARRQLGYLPENTPLYPDMRVREFLAYRARLKGLDRRTRQTAIDKVIEGCWLSEVKERIVGHLSKGFRQRVGLADCLLGDPKLLILDEPTVGLDPNQVRQTRQLISQLGQERTVFLSTHILHEVELTCQEVIIIHQGAIVARGKTKDLCERYDGPRQLSLQLQEADAPREELLKVRGVTEVAVGEDGRLLLTCQGDPRREISRLVSEKGWLVEEMALEPVRLEEIFSRLTLAPASEESSPLTPSEKTVALS